MHNPRVLSEIEIGDLSRHSRHGFVPHKVLARTADESAFIPSILAFDEPAQETDDEPVKDAASEKEAKPDKEQKQEFIADQLSKQDAQKQMTSSLLKLQKLKPKRQRVRCGKLTELYKTLAYLCICS